MITTGIPPQIISTWRWRPHNIVFFGPEVRIIDEPHTWNMLNHLWRFMRNLHGDIDNSLHYADGPIEQDQYGGKQFKVNLPGGYKLALAISYRQRIDNRREKCMGYFMIYSEEHTIYINHVKNDPHMEVTIFGSPTKYYIYGNFDIVFALYNPVIV